METIRFIVVDGLKIFTGFDSLLIDGVATRKSVGKRVSSLSSYRESLDLATKIERMKDAKATEVNRLDLERLKSSYLEVSESLNSEMISIYNEEKRFFEPRLNELIPSDVLSKHIRDLLSSSGPNEVISILESGAEIIPNLKGKVYYIYSGGDIITETIKEVGVGYPEGSFLSLSKSQENIISGGLLKQEEIQEALSLANSKKGQFEILGDSAEVALEKSRAWYNEEILRIENDFLV